ncbi:MAG TPA: tRNA (adenosine(37)-N6)-dimethylallyltransferase MiaA [Xanthomonadaceae bacterium]|nr:tRNA (adenosine(37)-N6)-dimethylallyltransferase MiaA [Xanthomonadaceae bacterium]
MGPTAAGKTALATRWAARWPLEAVSVDSALVYRGLDIGTAKPDRETLRALPHHLIDIRDPDQPYSAAEFAADAELAMRRIVEVGRVPILVGGTGLYFRALLEGLSDLPPADPAVRARIEHEAAGAGWPQLHAELARVDPEAAARIHPADPQRIQRALEVYRVSGRPLSRWQVRGPARRLGFRVLRLAAVPGDRALLHRRIQVRFDSMLAQGFLEEVRALQHAGLDPALPALRSVGYRQAWQHLRGRCDADGFRSAAIAATRQLAKRQITWLRARPDVRWLDPELRTGEFDRALAAFLGGA